MTTINIKRNVYLEEDIPLNVSDDYVERFPVARINYPITMNISPVQPHIDTETSAIFDTPMYMSVSTIRAELQGGTFPYYSGDSLISSCQLYASGEQVNGSFQVLTSTNAYHGMGSYITEEALGDKSWIPFTVNENQGQTIISATLTLTCSETRSRKVVRVKMGCQSYEYATPLARPTNYNEMNARVLTSAVYYYSTSDGGIADWIVNTPYYFDITASVQEILNKTSWTTGSTMAVMIHNNGSTANMDREFWAASNTTQAYQPTLTIIR